MTVYRGEVDIPGLAKNPLAQQLIKFAVGKATENSSLLAEPTAQKMYD